MSQKIRKIGAVRYILTKQTALADLHTVCKNDCIGIIKAFQIHASRDGVTTFYSHVTKREYVWTKHSSFRKYLVSQKPFDFPKWA